MKEIERISNKCNICRKAEADHIVKRSFFGWSSHWWACEPCAVKWVMRDD